MKDPHLADVLERATADLPVVDRSRAAWDRAQRVRRRRAGAAAGTTVLLVVVAVAAASAWQQGGDGDLRPPVTTQSPPTDETADAEPAAWDPFTLPDLPRGDSVLPERLDPPESAPSVLDAPLPAAVVAWPREGRDLMLLGVDGEWRSVPGTANAVEGTPGGVVAPTLSPDGSRVALAADDGLLIVDVAAGEQQVLEWPAELSPPWDDPPAVQWLPGGGELAVLHWRRTWTIGLDGSAAVAPYRSRSGTGLMVDPAGPVLEVVDGQLLEWEGQEVVNQWVLSGSAQRPVTQYGLVAATGSDGWNRGGPIVIDASSGRVVAAALARERSSEYSDNALLTAQGFLDERTVLVLVAPAEFDGRGLPDLTWYLAAWDFRAGTFERITEGDTRMQAIDVAPALVGRGSP